MTTKNGYYTNEDIYTYEEREARKNPPSEHALPEETESLTRFEEKSEMRWARVIRGRRPLLDDYRSEVVRGCIFLEEEVSSEIIEKYSPATGVLKMVPGQSSYYPKGLKKDELVNEWRGTHGNRLMPTGLLELCRKSKQ